MYLERLKRDSSILTWGFCPSQTETHILSFKKLQEWQLLDAFTPTYLPIIFAFKGLSSLSSHVHWLIQLNLILHGSFSLQRLARTFHFDPLSEGTQCISDWTGYTRWSQPFLCCSHSAAWQGIPLQRQLWALGTTQRVTHCRGSCWPSQGNAGKCFQGCSLFRAGIRLQDLLANQPHFLILYS